MPNGRLATLFAATGMLLACGDGPTTDGSASAPLPPSQQIESSFTLKLLRGTGENPFSQLAYECHECTFAQHAAVEPPPGFTKSPACGGRFL